MGKAKWFFSASGLILLVCALAMSGKGINFGIDFDGGTRITASLEKAATVEQVRDTLGPMGLADAKIQTLTGSGLGDHVVQISTEELGPNRVGEANNRLEQAYGFPADTQPSVESIGPSFGESVANSALDRDHRVTERDHGHRPCGSSRVHRAVLIAVLHDILIVAGVYALLRPGGDHVDRRGVADRLGLLAVRHDHRDGPNPRENVPRMPSAAFSQIVNRSLSEVIVRSLATSFCTAAGGRADVLRR